MKKNKWNCSQFIHSCSIGTLIAMFILLLLQKGISLHRDTEKREIPKTLIRLNCYN